MHPDTSGLHRRSTYRGSVAGVDADPESGMSGGGVVVDDHRAAVLTFKELVVKTRAGKVLLNKISGVVKPGIWAVMGPSGSGKSTLLNTLACRLDRNTLRTGNVHLNGSTYTNADLKKVAGYVMQDDLLNGNLTTEETLRYTGELRLPEDFTQEQRQARVDEVLKQMGLEGSRNTVIGTPLRKGLSGGERKRLCVGMELLTHPSLLFLDEPTSGLDSVAALSLCSTLKNLSHTWNCTIVCTIHQPQSKIFNLFEYLILLKSGSIVYQGSTQGAMETYARAGYPCPPLTNPADHLLDVIQPSLGQGAGAEYNEVTEKLLKNFEAPEVDLALGSDRVLKMDRKRVTWLKQFWVLVQRSGREALRRWPHTATLLVQTVVMALLIGTVFLRIGTGDSSLVKRQPSLFFCVINQGIFGALITINSFPSERMLVLRERAAGTYYVSAYYAAKSTVETLTTLPVPVLFSCVVYFLVGYQAVASKFFIFMAFMILTSVAATSLALMVSAWCRTTDLSVIVLPLALEVSRLFGGFFLSPANLPAYFVWLDALSYVKWTYIGISLNELQGLELTCTTTTPCPSGQSIIESFGMEQYSIGACAGILIAYIVVCRILALIAMRVVKW